MQRPQIHVLAIVGALLALFAMVSGAALTAAATPSRLHPGLGGALMAVLLVIASGVFRGRTLAPLRGWVLGAFILWLLSAITYSMPAIHASISALFFTALTCIALLSSAGWERGPEPFDPKRWPVLTKLAAVTPVVTVLQILLGAAYRHKAMGVMPHLAGAMLVALAILGLSVFVLQSLPEHPRLRSAAIWALTAVLVQVTLGIAVLVMGMLDAGDSDAAKHTAVAHIVTAALTLSAGSALALHIRRDASA